MLVTPGAKLRYLLCTTFSEGSQISLGHFNQLALDKIGLGSWVFPNHHLMTGYQIGYLYANKQIIEWATLLQEEIVTCPSTIAQYLALHVMTSSRFDLSNVIDIYRQRVIGTMNTCDDWGLSYIKASWCLLSND